ncbi:MAG: hypothetical protein ABIQ87_18695 [Rubrivivax sp.]
MHIHHAAPQPPQPVRPNPEPDVPGPVPAPDDAGEPLPPLEEGEAEAQRPGRTGTRH